jgi:hypothetical protein
MKKRRRKVLPPHEHSLAAIFGKLKIQMLFSGQGFFLMEQTKILRRVF